MMGHITVVDLYSDKGQHSGAVAQWTELRIYYKKRTRIRMVCRGDELGQSVHINRSVIGWFFVQRSRDGVRLNTFARDKGVKGFYQS